jgi:beta-carotene ketolase (CrtW type)
MGVWIAVLIVSLWMVNLFFGLRSDLTHFSVWHVVLVVLQTHLYTGIFITAHDAMHGTVSKNRTINFIVGFLCASLFAFNNYIVLNRKHHLHHRFPATEHDPDFHDGNFFVWLFSFAKQYITIWQIGLMGLSFNLLGLYFPKENLLLFWAFPSVLSVFQLFYFGTYLPHKNAPDNTHRARSLSKNHVWAFVSCYFFGYHYEHHDSPGTPWWKLYTKKN